MVNKDEHDAGLALTVNIVNWAAARAWRVHCMELFGEAWRLEWEKRKNG